MSSEFWIQSNEMDQDQKRAVENINENDSFLLTGPAGSGKTNILLLRAKWFRLKNLSDFRIIVFTNSLKQFVQAGCSQYGLDESSVMTQISFFKGILAEYGIAFEFVNDFETDRNMLAGKMMSLIESGQISNSYCTALLVDEAQDYTDTELLVFKKLTNRLILALDSRQSIYKQTYTSGLPEKLTDNNIVSLKFHYRSGLNLCKVADAILSDTSIHAKIQTNSLYPESTLPSSVRKNLCETFAQQCDEILKNLESQLPLYSGQKIGVLFPKRKQVDEFRGFLNSSSLEEPDRIQVQTLHGAKGWEFPAVHIAGCEDLSKMGPTQKRLIYTGILRGKTSASIYYSGHLPGYLDAALAVLNPPPPSPSIDELF